MMHDHALSSTYGKVRIMIVRPAAHLVLHNELCANDRKFVFAQWEAKWICVETSFLNSFVTIIICTALCHCRHANDNLWEFINRSGMVLVMVIVLVIVIVIVMVMQMGMTMMVPTPPSRSPAGSTICSRGEASVTYHQSVTHSHFSYVTNMELCPLYHPFVFVSFIYFAEGPHRVDLSNTNNWSSFCICRTDLRCWFRNINVFRCHSTEPDKTK